MAYRRGAFDAYDVLGTTGPYQEGELQPRYRDRQRPTASPRSASSNSTGSLPGFLARITPHILPRRPVLIAPSWGSTTCSTTCGGELVESVAAQGFRTVYSSPSRVLRVVVPRGGSHRRDASTPFRRPHERGLRDLDHNRELFLRGSADDLRLVRCRVRVRVRDGAPRPVRRRRAQGDEPGLASLGIVPFEEPCAQTLGACSHPATPPGRRCRRGPRAEFGELRSADREPPGFGRSTTSASRARVGAAVIDALID